MPEANLPYWSTTEGQFIAGAHRYLSASKLLTESPEWKRGRLLQTPTLHLLCHGIELLLKFPLLRSGMGQADVRRFGHNLLALWKDDANTALRSHVVVAGEVAWQVARDSGKWPRDDFTAEPIDVIEKAVVDLSELHDRQSGFALRYSFEGERRAPRPRFLVEAFGQVAERCVANPAYLDQ